MDRFRIGQARRDDLDAILEIDRYSFPLPWPRDAFEQEFELPFSGLYVARADAAAPGPILGYVNFWVVENEVHILSIAVRADLRRRGVGRALLDVAETVGVERGGRYIFLEVRKSNRAALDLYRTAGYSQVGVRRGYYSDNGEDAIVMAKVLAETLEEDGS